MDNSWVRDGARCVPVKSSKIWRDRLGNEFPHGPSNGDILTVKGVVTLHSIVAIVIVGHDGLWLASNFRPLTTAESDAELFADIARHAAIDTLMGELSSVRAP